MPLAVSFKRGDTKINGHFSRVRKAIDACEEPHRQLHESASKIEAALKQGDIEGAQRIYRKVTLPNLEMVAQQFGLAVAAEQAIVDSQKKASLAFSEKTLPALSDTQNILAKLKNRANALVGDMKKANGVYATKTKPNLEKVQDLLCQIRDTTAKRVMTDEQMLQKAQSTRWGVIVSALS